ncbi:hypothetical protein CCMA1212_009085 [Trichoderma ghanense]|uniref:Uncharacterized protein n=1 Tax=Trichoderma ghanense TaxID=65468 RepID=A0ABY2GVU1_9HYPO
MTQSSVLITNASRGMYALLVRRIGSRRTIWTLGQASRPLWQPNTSSDRTMLSSEANPARYSVKRNFLAFRRFQALSLSAKAGAPYGERLMKKMGINGQSQRSAASTWGGRFHPRGRDTKIGYALSIPLPGARDG